MSQESHPNPTPSRALKQVHRIAGFFDLPGPFEISDYSAKGNINRATYLVSAGQSGDRREYLLQMLNTNVFANPVAVMDTMVACIKAQRKALSEGAIGDQTAWEPLRLIPTKEGAPYLKTEVSARPQYWRMMARIRGVRSFKNLGAIPERSRRLKIAEEAGRGLALFRTLTAGMNPADIQCPLPGYRDTALYYDQLASVLSGNRTPEQASARMPSDPRLRRDTGQLFIIRQSSENLQHRLRNRQVQHMAALALDQKSFCLKLQKKLAAGDLARTIVHGDTKLENFLFSTQNHRVKSLVDLDTVMPHTWLSDWGDMVRSLVNISGEREQEPEHIQVDMDIFEALARGFIRSAPLPPRHEMELMVDAARIMAMELGVRFLTDYLRGDTYFRPASGDPEDLNKIRAAVQFSVFQRLGDQAHAAGKSIVELCGERKKT